MAGVKGRSGVRSTPEARQRLREAGRMGAKANQVKAGAGTITTGEDEDLFANTPAKAKGKSATKTPPIDDDELLRLLPGSNPYDKVVIASRGRFTYLDGKTREQVRGVELDNETKAAASAVAKGKLFTNEQIQSNNERITQVFLTELQTINQQLTALVPADRLLAAQATMRDWIDTVRTKVADAIEGDK